MKIEFFADVNGDGTDEYSHPISGDFTQEDIDRVVATMDRAIGDQSSPTVVPVRFGVKVDGAIVKEVSPPDFRHNDVPVVGYMVSNTLSSIAAT